MDARVIYGLAMTVGGVGCVLCGVALAALPALRPPVGGPAGAARRRARESLWFRLAEVPLSVVGAWVAAARRGLDLCPSWSKRWRSVEARLDSLLCEAGQPAGLSREEVIAAVVLLPVVTGATLAGVAVPLPGFLTWVALLGAAALPVVRLQALRAARLERAARDLPGAIDLLALAMSAGSDFPHALGRVIGRRQGVVATELSLVLRALDLGVTRKRALLELERRLPAQEVRDLVRAVVLAEQKGASVAEALSQQAESSRQQRSVRAEERAARAGALLLLPMMFLFGCVMILLLGPLLLQAGM